MPQAASTDDRRQPAAATDRPDVAHLYRMVMPDHLCPFGLKSKHLLESAGYEVEDHHLTSRAQVEAFKAEHGVPTTPQTFIGGRRIGGHDDLARHLGRRVRAPGQTSYVPVLAIFGVAALLALAISWAALGTVLAVRTAEWFIAVAMVLLGLQKLRDIESFSTMFLNYDLLARRWVPYGHVYPWAETGAGLLMVAGLLVWIAAPVALFIGTVGAVSVIKAVWIDRRELRCACVGGDSTVPLGVVSLTENLMMVAMALWMLARATGLLAVPAI